MDPLHLLPDDTHADVIGLLRDKRNVLLSGASNETAKTLLITKILLEVPSNSILVTEDNDSVHSLLHWLDFFGTEGQELPAIESDEGEIDPLALRAFLRFMRDGGMALVSRDVWEKDFPSLVELHSRTTTLSIGQEIDFIGFIEDLLRLGYSHGDDAYLHPGEYRRQGDRVDIFPIQSAHPYRITLHFDTIESFHIVDSEDRSKVTPHTGDLEIVPLLYSEQLPLCEQLSTDHLLILDDQDDIETPSIPSTLRFTSFPEAQDCHIHVRYLSVLKFYTLTDFLNDVRDKLQQQWSLFIVSKRIDELTEICKEEHIPHSTTEKRREGALTLVDASEIDLLPHSLQNPDLKLALLTDREIFSLRKGAKQRGVQKLALDFITSLVPGDYVVHMDHGVSHFEGMTQKEVDGTIREYLDLTYAEGDKLYVPVDQADKLSKFVYEEGNEPHLTRLGTQEWKKITEKMKRETEKIAKELLALYAKRAKAKGFRYQEDNDVSKKFEEAFPHTETPGQLKAIEDIRHDMENDHPMDRLVCGDVGFGKTEVAMRAAFKAVQDGKQVAVVAPITILADQHFRNFSERMEGFNVRIEMLSRFRTAAQQREILEKLRKGDLDIVIGTHRLLQDDVHFLNLGLVIIDEEQRFGVKQKEKLKEMRASVDILTLTATPIPRTLNLGLHKLRDITTITTPPPGRLPIITEVRKYSDVLLREAILKEKEREGQVYVLHNRVETIDAFADKLRAMIPECSFIVGHGQLKPEELEKRITEFKEGQYDVLVSSTIIENGIDLPRANTLIVNEAERFGLSQLYQLRGRVGRSDRQAYAYFLYHTQKLKDDAKKRLRAIVEACELGSGFQVAMRDLEIRGAGEILGAEQSGTMQTVGVSHYLRMLKAAVEELKRGKKGEIDEEENVEILLPVEAMLPAYYIPDEQERISVYQKLAGSGDEEILAEFEDDLREEFGNPPAPVANLFAILRLKMVCRRAGVLRIKMDHGVTTDEVVLTLSARVTAKEIMQMLQINAHWKISGSSLRIDVTQMGDGDLVHELTTQISALQKATKTMKK